jgi:hypothetical protein
MTKEQLINKIAELEASDAAAVLLEAVQRVGEHGRPAGGLIKPLVADLDDRERLNFEEGLAWLNEADAA